MKEWKERGRRERIQNKVGGIKERKDEERKTGSVEKKNNAKRGGRKKN